MFEYSPPRMYRFVPLACGAAGGAVATVLWRFLDVELVLSASVGANVSLFLWAFPLYAGWHLLDEEVAALE